jgi:hypothetical protein
MTRSSASCSSACKRTRKLGPLSPRLVPHGSRPTLCRCVRAAAGVGRRACRQACTEKLQAAAGQGCAACTPPPAGHLLNDVCVPALTCSRSVMVHSTHESLHLHPCSRCTGRCRTVCHCPSTMRATPVAPHCRYDPSRDKDMAEFLGIIGDAPDRPVQGGDGDEDVLEVGNGHSWKNDMCPLSQKLVSRTARGRTARGPGVEWRACSSGASRLPGAGHWAKRGVRGVERRLHRVCVRHAARGMPPSRSPHRPVSAAYAPWHTGAPHRQAWAYTHHLLLQPRALLP